MGTSCKHVALGKKEYHLNKVKGTESQCFADFYEIIEQFGVEGTFKGHLVPPAVYEDIFS